MGREVKLETVVVLQLGDSLVAIWERALVEGARHHVLVIKVPEPQGLLAVQKYPEKNWDERVIENMTSQEISPTDWTNLLGWF